jgi:hypothetical protein
LVVNGTRRRVRATVVSGRDSTDCGCSIAPGDSLRLGYYPLLPGSAVQIEDAAHARGRFNAAEMGVDSATGAVAIRVPTGSLAAASRAAPRPAPRRAAPARAPAPASSPNPLKGFLPVR